jgi:hypothetical protein
MRHYGFLSPNSHKPIEVVRWLVALYYGLVFLLLAKVPQEGLTEPRIRCADYGGPMRVLTFLPRVESAYFDTS